LKKISLFICLFFLLQGVIAQKKYWVKISFEPAHEKLSKQYLSWQLVDSVLLSNYFQTIKLQCYDEQFLSTQIQTNFITNDSLIAHYFLGKTYLINRLDFGNVPIEWLGREYKMIGSQKIKANHISKYFNMILDFAENNGYPFAQIGLDSILVDSNGVKAQLNLVKNRLVLLDSIDFGGTAKMDKMFLQLFANYKPGAVYQEDLLKKLDSRLSELPYVQVAQPMGVYFYGNKARPYVYINQRKASSFDGVIGFAPNSTLNNRLVLTGDMNLKLANLFGSGKNFELTYRGYLNNSQDLQMKFLWPYFLKTKLALDFSFKLAKFDSTWIEIANDIGLQYRLGGNNYLKFYFQNQTINSFVVDSQFVKINKRLPAVHDVVNNLYGLAIRKSTLDYFNNPRKGFLLNLEVGAGTKRIVPMEGLQQLKLSGSNAEVYNLYDSIQLLTMQYKLQGNFSYYLNFRKNWVLHSQINTAMLMNQNLFFNELFRIGGLKTLKGFDEQSIFANKYLIGNFELRYLFLQNSGFMIFWNGAWYENTALPQVRVDKPWGVGVGMNIETGAGVFSLYYALGKQLGNEFEFQRAKIHFGFVNFF
jgi:uncharacterized membrane protein (DUF485 family)